MTVTCVSLQLHLSFTRPFLLHSSFTCGLLDQQSVPWMFHYWLVGALMLDSTEQSLVFSESFTYFGPFFSFQWLSSQTVPSNVPWPKPTVWPITVALVSELVNHFVSGKTIDYFLRVLHLFTSATWILLVIYVNKWCTCMIHFLNWTLK